MGSPIGAYFTRVTGTPGSTPMSRKCWRREPFPPTLRIVAVCPIFSSARFIFFYAFMFVDKDTIK
jgi:hypothetical protein